MFFRAHDFNDANYLQVLRRDLTRALHRKRPELDIDDLLLHQDNAPPHRAANTTLELGLLGLDTVEHPPYSPDLAPMDFKVFPIVKSALKGYRFQDFRELALAIQRVVSTFDEEWYTDMFNQWIDRHGKCVATHGDYVEK